MTNNITYKKNWLKFAIGFVLCFLIRIIPLRPPNIEPILATQIPFSRAFGAWAGFFFAFLSIVLFDFVTNKLGAWTLLVAFTYGILGWVAAFYFRSRKGTPLEYAIFAVWGTIFFDAVTGLTIGPIFFGQSFMEALLGQIPFTLWHLLGNIAFALTLSPVLYRFVIQNEKLEFSSQPAYEK